MGSGQSAHLGVELIQATADEDLFEVRRLLQAGASPTITLMTESQGPITALFMSVKTSNMNIFLHLIRAGAPVNVVCGNDRATPLMIASAIGNLDMMKVLMQRGALLGIGDKDNDTALHYAALFGNAAAAAFLLKNHANPNAKNNQLRTPLHLACQKGELGVIMVLKSAGASSHITDATGKKPADLALLTGNGAAILLLLAAE